MIDNLINKQCCGCGGCVQVCPKSSISMSLDREGFPYPIINYDTCIKCGLCEKICPGLQDVESSVQLNSYACINIDDAIRQESSSGGFFNSVASDILKNGGVVYGASFNADNGVAHIRIDNLRELYKIRKSKYIQSDINNTFNEVKEDLKSGLTVLYSGTPCQIKALNLFLGKKSDNLLTIDVACHGVPSKKIWETYLEYICIDIKKPYVIDFRDKNKPWHNYSLTIKQDGKTIVSEACDKNVFMKSFVNNLCCRPSCHYCPAKSFSSGSDIMIADYWGIERFYPEMDDNKGTSLVITKTSKGEHLFKKVKADFLSIKTDFSTVDWRVDTFYTSAQAHYKREKFLKIANSKNFAKLVNSYLKHDRPFFARIIRKMESLL